jgi:hypothetical protein
MLKHVTRICLAVGITIGGLGVSSGFVNATPAPTPTDISDQQAVPMACNFRACENSCIELGYCVASCATGSCTCTVGTCN